MSINPAYNRKHIKDKDIKDVLISAGKRLILIGIPLVLLGLLQLGEDDIIIDMGIKSFKFFERILVSAMFFIVGYSIFPIIKWKVEKSQRIEELGKELEEEKASDLKKDISIDELKLSIKAIRNDWVRIINEGEDWEDEYRYSLGYLDRIKDQLDEISKIQKTLNMLIETNGEETLTEVVKIIESAKTQLVNNSVSCINHMRLEIVIEGYDKENILSYLDDNDDIIKQSSDLIKSALLYMDGKANSKGMQEYIKSMVETLNRLKEKN